MKLDSHTNATMVEEMILLVFRSMITIKREHRYNSLIKWKELRHTDPKKHEKRKKETKPKDGEACKANQIW